MKLVDEYMAMFFNFKTTSNHLHPLQVENCDSNSGLVVDEDENGKSRPERVKFHIHQFFSVSKVFVFISGPIFFHFRQTFSQ